MEEVEEKEKEKEKEKEALESMVDKLKGENRRLRASQAKVGGRLAESLSAAADMAAAVNQNSTSTGAATSSAASAIVMAESLEKTVMQQQAELLQLKSERDERAAAHSRLQADHLAAADMMLGTAVAEGPAITHLQGVVARCSHELEEHNRQFYAYKEEQAGTIDKRLATRLLVSYVSKIKESNSAGGSGGSGRRGSIGGSSSSASAAAAAQCDEVLGVIAKMMGFEESDKIKVGLVQQMDAGDANGNDDCSRSTCSSTRRRRGSRGAMSTASAAADAVSTVGEGEGEGATKSRSRSRSRPKPPPPSEEARIRTRVSTSDIAYVNPMNE